MSPAGAAMNLVPNPLEMLGEAAGKAVAEGWTGLMLTLWDTGLWLLRLVLSLLHNFLTPDLSQHGPGREVYAYSFWMAAVLMVIMLMIQLGVTAFRRDGKSLARVLIGAAQFVIVWFCWIAYGVTIVAACGGLTDALMRALLQVDAWQDWQPLAVSTEDISNATVATVLGILGIFLVLAAIGHLLVYLVRAAALLVLVATGPISAAGLVSEFGRSWFWKSLRWFHAAAFTPVVMVLVLGLGVKLSNGVAHGLTNSTAQAVGTAVPSVLLICVSMIAPLSLFKLLAFVEPGTPSGAALRAGLSAQGGLQGLLSGNTSSSTGTSGAAAVGSNGRSAGESAGEDATSERFNKGTQAALSGLGAVGTGLAAGLGAVETVGSKGAAVGADLTNQMGVGNTSYHPDFSGLHDPPRRAGSNGSTSGSGRGPGGGGGDESDHTDGPASPGPPPTEPVAATQASLPPAPSRTASNTGPSSQPGAGGAQGRGGAGPGKGGPSGGGTSGAAGAASKVPPPA